MAPVPLNSHALWARVAELDRDVMLKWNETRDIWLIDDMLRKVTSELSHLDTELIEHWDQLSLALLLGRLFHERASRAPFSDPRKPERVIECVLRGSVTGNVIGRVYNPDSPTSQALCDIARIRPLWETLQSVLTFHQRLDKEGRKESRTKLSMWRRVLLMESGIKARD